MIQSLNSCHSAQARGLPCKELALMRDPTSNDDVAVRSRLCNALRFDRDDKGGVRS